MRKTKKCFVSLEKPTQISYWLSLALLLKIDRKGLRDWLSEILSFLKLRKAAPPEQSPPLFSPLSWKTLAPLTIHLWVGTLGPFFFLKRWFRESTNRQIRSPGDSQPPSRPNGDEANQVAFWLIQGAAKPNSIKARGAYFSWRWVILFQFSYANGTRKVFRWYGPPRDERELPIA